MMAQGNGRKPGEEGPEPPPPERKDRGDFAEESDVGEGQDRYDSGA